MTDHVTPADRLRLLAGRLGAEPEDWIHDDRIAIADELDETASELERHSAPEPTRPDPGVPERAPDLVYGRRHPSERPPNPSRREDYSGPRWLAIFGVLVGLVLCIAFGIAVSQPKPKDERELRRYGDLECIYNVTRDHVEACS